MPGVLIIEPWLRLVRCWRPASLLLLRFVQVMYLMTIDQAKFRKPVLPGVVLRLEVVPLRKGTAAWKMRGVKRRLAKPWWLSEFLAQSAPAHPTPVPHPLSRPLNRPSPPPSPPFLCGRPASCAPRF